MTINKKKLNSWCIVAVIVLGLLFISDSRLYPDRYISLVYLLFGILLCVLGGLTHCIISKDV